MLAESVALTVLCGMAGWRDVVSGRIPNVLTYGGILLGLSMALIQPPHSAGSNLMGLLMGFGLLVPFWFKSMIGGGDVKLSMMVGALKGPGFLLYFLFYLFSVCIVAILYTAVVRVGLLRSGLFFFQTFWSLLTFRAFPQPPDELKNIRMPFGLYAMIATVICVVLEGSGHLASPFE